MDVGLVAVENRVKKIQVFGQSIWLDFIDRNLLNSGQLQQLIDEDGIKGLTSNPAIFEKAISSGKAYDDDVIKLSDDEQDNEVIFYRMAVMDIQRAADILLQVYNQQIPGADGYISLEVSPYLAKDKDGTIHQAMKLWGEVGRKNVMIKIPATKECLPAIRYCISEGINVNVTLIFGLQRYGEVLEAYLSGLEDRVKSGKPVDQIASVASFFLSRIDLMVDPILNSKGITEYTGQVAIACAKMAYQDYKRVFNNDRFVSLQQKGANPQRLLWASTGNKNPGLADTRYVEALIGQQTVNTVPMETLDAFRDHGTSQNTLEQDTEKAGRIITALEQNGIDMCDISQRLEDEGVKKFVQPYTKMLQAIEKVKAVNKQ